MHSYNRHLRTLEKLSTLAINEEGTEYIKDILKDINKADLMVFSVEQTEKAVEHAHKDISDKARMGKYQDALWLPIKQNIQEGTTISTIYRCLTFHEIEDETYQVITTSFHPNGIGLIKNSFVACFESKIEKQDGDDILLIDPNCYLFESNAEGIPLRLVYSGYINDAPEYMDQHELRKTFYDSIGGCFFSVLWAYMPRQTLIRESSEKIQKKYNKKNKKALRFDARPHIKIFDPEEVKVLYSQKDSRGGTHASPVPHVRRSHVRRYNHPRYTNMRGKTQSVSGAVVNAEAGEEFKIGKQVYCIMKVGELSPLEGLEL